MVGGDAAQVAADEGHHRAALPLPVQVEEVADDQPERVQVPVQRRGEPGGAQHHMAQPLDLRRVPGRPLRGVRPHRPGSEVQRQRAAFGQGRQFRHAVHHPHREPARVPQQDGVAAPVRRDRAPGAAGQPVKVLPGGGGEGGPGETGPRAAAHDQACGGRPPAAQQQRVRGPVGHGEAEVGAEPLRAVQVGLLELQPGQAGHLDQRITRPSGMLPRQAPCLAVQRPVRVLSRLLVRRSHGRALLSRHDRLLRVPCDLP